MLLCFGTTPTVQQTMVFDRVVNDGVNRAVDTRRHASGKPVNVARVLHTLGTDAGLCLPLGGKTGRFMARDIRAAGIRLESTEIAGETRICFTAIDRSAGTATEFIEEHPRISESELGELRKLFLSQLSTARMLILSGALAAGVEDGFYADCCEAAKGLSIPVILDARGTPLTLALNRGPLIVKPNRSELAATVGKALDDDASLRKAMLAMQREGAQWVIVTMGKEGAVVCDGSRFWKIPALRIDVVSAIGSGDAFTAGLAAAIASGRDVPDACRLGTACAAANALMPGAGILRMEDVRRLEPLVRIERF